jgi:hypothetical protein
MRQDLVSTDLAKSADSVIVIAGLDHADGVQARNGSVHGQTAAVHHCQEHTLKVHFDNAINTSPRNRTPLAWFNSLNAK